MAKLSHAHKLTARTAPAVVDGMGEALGRAKRAGLKFQAGPGARRLKVGMEGVIGAVCLHFLDLPEAEQDRIVKDYLPRLETMLAAPPAAGAPASPIRQVDARTGRVVTGGATGRKGAG